MRDDVQRQMARAIGRYRVVAAYLALKPRARRRRPALAAVSAGPWTDALGRPLEVTPELVRVWIRRWRRQGLAGLVDRPRRGVRCSTVIGGLSADELAAVRRLTTRSAPPATEDAAGLGRGGHG